MRRRELDKRLDRLEGGPSPEDEKTEIKKQIVERVAIATLNEATSLMAPGFKKSRDPKDRQLEPEAVRLWGEAYTEGQLREEAIRRVFDNLEEVLRKPTGDSGDLLQYASPEDLTPEGKERLRQKWVEAERRRMEESGESWAEVNRLERERREKTGEG
jgi:hypothetical protein